MSPRRAVESIEQASGRRKSRAATVAATAPEVATLRSRVAEQAATNEQLGRKVEWLTEELTVRDAEFELMLMDLAAAGMVGKDDTRVAYIRMLQRLRRLVHDHVVSGSRLVVVSSGEEALLRFVGCEAEHLSQDRFGGYSGFHPSCSRAAIVQLEAARGRGADVLVIPQSGLWWLPNYADFARHLERRYASVALEEETGGLWDLRKPSPLREVDELLGELNLGLGRQPVILDWHTGTDLANRFNEYNVFSPGDDDSQLRYLDDTIDVVAIPGTDSETVSEARRVAGTLVVAIREGGSSPAAEVVWRAEPTEGISVSIVVAAREGQPSTPAFLRHLVDSLPSSFTGEVVVDTSDDLAQSRLGYEAIQLPRVKVLRSPSGASFAARVRRLVEAACGDVVVVLDGSTWPVAGWLPPLLQTLRHVSRAGVVGGMLLRPDGRPAHAGGPRAADDEHSITPDRDDLLDGYTHVQRLDVVPSGLFATHRDLLREVELTKHDDQELTKALCAHTRSGGMRVLWQPDTIAILPWSNSGRGLGATDGRPMDD
jgi:hypothetical protein